jgi:hypothetical protein
MEISQAPALSTNIRLGYNWLLVATIFRYREATLKAFMYRPYSPSRANALAYFDAAEKEMFL